MKKYLYVYYYVQFNIAIHECIVLRYTLWIWFPMRIMLWNQREKKANTRRYFVLTSWVHCVLQCKFHAKKIKRNFLMISFCHIILTCIHIFGLLNFIYLLYTHISMRDNIKVTRTYLFMWLLYRTEWELKFFFLYQQRI